VRRAFHDKLVATPPELPDGDWPIACGAALTLIEWMGLKLAFLICLDVELPAIAAKLEGEAIDLLIVPSMTGALSGYHRVFDCAKARAIELFASVAVVGGIGEMAWNLGPNCAGASVFVPCETELGSTGRLASVGPLAQIDGPGPLMMADVPVGAVRRLRAAGPEAWPGPFPAHAIVQSHPEAAD
jgi:predicted amidohydrolase